MNTPVDFKLAELLKEKGYRILPDFESSYPTIAEVVMWLYEKHGIWVVVDYSLGQFSPVIKRQGQKAIPIKHWNFFPTPTEAYEVAIEYTLTKILKQ